MSANDGDEQTGASVFITRDEAEDLVLHAIDTDPDEPESLVKLLLLLFDNYQYPALNDTIYRLMKAAYDSSLVHSFDFQDYLEVIRSGRNPLDEARARRSR